MGRQLALLAEERRLTQKYNPPWTGSVKNPRQSTVD